MWTESVPFLSSTSFDSKPVKQTALFPETEEELALWRLMAFPLQEDVAFSAERILAAGDVFVAQTELDLK